MKTKIIVALLVLAGIATACVTINVYFPEAAAEQAATTLIRDVLGEEQAGGNDTSAGGGQALESGPDNKPRAYWDPLQYLIPVAQAQNVNIDINTPPVRAIRDRMRSRQQNQLQKYFDAGAIGFSNDGMVEIKDRTAVSLAERNQLNQLVKAENDDRQALYREIAIANDHPEWESKIRSTFARRWIELAPSGWYYQNNSGAWQQK